MKKNKLFNKLIAVFFFSSVFTISYAFRNIAYVEVNQNALSNVGCFIQDTTNKPFFDTAVIFSANIHGADPNNPNIYLNPETNKLLNDTQQVSFLQQKGIKVLVALLGDHQNAGWSCVTTPEAANKFAENIANFVDKYKLDGVAIDDEYSNCSTNSQSMLMIAKALKQNQKFKGKTLQKVLLPLDYSNFIVSYGKQNVRLADFLDSATPGYYPGNRFILLPYLLLGMTRNTLFGSVSTTLTNEQAAKSYAAKTLKRGWGGLMVFNLTAQSASFVNALEEGEYGKRDISVLPNCLSTLDNNV